MSKKNVLLIVESPAKAKTIKTYLKDNDDNYIVLASYGHIRQIPRVKNAIKPNDNFHMDWITNKASEKHIKDIVDAASALDPVHDIILLATDLDREGNAIAFHIQDILQNTYAITVPIKRIMFKEITKSSILDAIHHHTDIDMNSVNSYFARLALDYLVGFSISPILWTKLKGCKSAGRVQSAALRAIIDRDLEAISFQPEEYWTLDAQFQINNIEYKAELHELYNSKISCRLMKDVVDNAKKDIICEQYKISSIVYKNSSTKPKAPLITSTLQQAAAQALGWTASKTMRIAQVLYEGVNIDGELIGLITYMRTDSVRITENIINDIHNMICKEYGDNYKCHRTYQSKTSSQDAHEAIRPTNVYLVPNKISKFLTPDEGKLYDLIWRYTIASQMSDMKINTMSIKIASANSLWGASQRHSEFDGFSVLFPDKIEKNEHIYNVKVDNDVSLINLMTERHTTKSRGHFTESSLIKYMDEVGIGRPSTYAAIMDILEHRGYIERNNKQICANPKGWFVIGLLNQFCPEYIQDDFTSNMEIKLDEIASGHQQWRNVMHDFWTQFVPVIQSGENLDAKSVLQNILDQYCIYFLGKNINKNCEKCNGTKVLCMTSKAEFIGCSNYPECTWIQNLYNMDEKILGQDTNTGENIIIRKGAYGHYLHWSNMKKNITLSDNLMKIINLDIAMTLKNMPIDIGQHALTKKNITINVGKYGSYIMHNGHYASCDITKIHDITLEQAMSILGASESKKKKKSKN